MPWRLSFSVRAVGLQRRPQYFVAALTDLCPPAGECYTRRAAAWSGRGRDVMSLGLTPLERLARARADLRMGAAVACSRRGRRRSCWRPRRRPRPGSRTCGRSGRSTGADGVAGGDAEGAGLRRGLARVALPADADLAWVRATADPSADLAYPMKGPYATRRGGGAGLHRAAVALCKQAHLLPAALVVPLERSAAAALAAAAGLTGSRRATCRRERGRRAGRGRRRAGAARGLRGGPGAGVPAARRGRGALRGGDRRAGPAARRCSAGCIRPASPAI